MCNTNYANFLLQAIVHKKSTFSILNFLHIKVKFSVWRFIKIYSFLISDISG